VGFNYKIKKVLLSVVAGGAGLSFFLVGSAAAATSGSVSGNVTENGAAASGIQVTVVCTDTNNSTFTHHVTTSSTGHYSTAFSAGDCLEGASVTASASDGSASGSVSGTMNSGLSLTNFNFDLTAAALPEFGGILTVSAAAALSAGAFVFVRKRYASQTAA
jgi:hypothetical protein